MQITSQTDIAILLWIYSRRAGWGVRVGPLKGVPMVIYPTSSPSSSAHVCGHVHDQRRQYYNLDEARSIVVNNSVSSVEKIKE